MSIRRIIYYVSGHGYGHAARQQPIIKLLAAQGVQIFVRTPTPAKFYNAPGVHLHQAHYDIGMIQSDASTVDPAATLAWMADFLARQESIIAEEAAFIAEKQIQLVVSDMPPIACEIAVRAAIPSIVLTHFTWDWVYEFYLDAYPQYQTIVDSIRDSYLKATLALQMPFAHPFLMFRRVEAIPLVVNPVTRPRELIRQDFQIPPDHRLALLSMGGFGWDGSDISALRQLQGWSILAVPGAWEQMSDLPHFHLIPTEYPDFHNLIAAADVLVGKSGGSTLAECIAHRTPIIYTQGDFYRENELLHDALCKFTNSFLVKKHEFEAGKWVELLDWIVTRDIAWPPMPTDGAAKAAARILDFLP